MKRIGREEAKGSKERGRSRGEKVVRKNHEERRGGEDVEMRK